MAQTPQHSTPEQGERKTELKTLQDLQRNGNSTDGHPPPLEGEPLHKRLARLNRELPEAVEALQAFNKEWAERNLKAQQIRVPISTPELTFAANKRRELAAEIQRLQNELGIANRERRALSAQASQKTSAGDKSAPLVVSPKGKKLTRSKECPLKDHREWPVYFKLAAREELTPSYTRRSNAAPNRY